MDRVAQPIAYSYSHQLMSYVPHIWHLLCFLTPVETAAKQSHTWDKVSDTGMKDVIFEEQTVWNFIQAEILV